MKYETTSMPLELSFLIYACKTSNINKRDTHIKEILSSCTLEYQKLIELAYQHTTLPLLYRTIKALAPTHTLVLLLKPYYLSNAQKNIAMAVELQTILSLLQKEHIEVLCFKGLALSQMAYGDITLRQFGDLDLLIHTKDKYKAVACLEAHHYTPEIILKAQNKRRFLDAVNVLGFYTPSQRLIEIHWELLSKNYAISWDETALWHQKQTITLNQHPIETLDTTTTLLYLCTHGSKHLFSRLSWLCDIDRTIQNHEVAWSKIIKEAKTVGILRIVQLSLSLSHTLLDTPLPPEIQSMIQNDTKVDTLAKKIIVLHFSTSHKKAKGFYVFKLLLDMREGVASKFTFGYAALFAPKFNDFASLQLPKSLGFLYPLLRVFRLFFKYLSHTQDKY